MIPNPAQIGRCFRPERVLRVSRHLKPTKFSPPSREASSQASAPPQLNTLRRAIANSNAHAARKDLSFFLTQEHIYTLNSRDLHDISGFLHKHPDVLHDLGLDPLVLLALHGQTDFINFSMRAAINEGRPQDVIKLWRRLHRVLKDALEPTMSSPPTISKIVLKTLKRPMAYTILALGLQRESIASALPIFLGLPPSVQITPQELEKFAFEGTTIQSQSSSPSPQSLSLQYLEILRVSRLLEHPKTTLVFLQEAFDAGDVNSVLGTLKILIQGAQSNPPWVAPTTSLEWPGSDVALVHMTEPMWSLAISGLIKAGRLDAAKLIWDQMSSLKVPQTAVTWNALLDGYGRRGKIEDGMKIWEAMGRNGVQKDLFSYTTMISALFEAKEADRGLEIFQELADLREKGLLLPLPYPTPTTATSNTAPRLASHDSDATPSSLSPSHLVVTYNAVLHGLLISARAAEANELFEKMRVTGPHPDITSFNTFIRHHSRKGDMKSIAALLRRLPELNIQPDVVTFTTVLHACMRAGVPIQDAIKTVETAMQASGIKPNVVTYTAIIDHTVRQGGQQNFVAAAEWLDVMQSKGLRPNEVTFTAILSALQNDSSLGRNFMETQSEAIVSRMRANGARMNRITFNILLKAALSSDNSVEGLEKAASVYGEMVKEGVHANADTWYMLLHGAVERREWDIGRRLVNEMDSVGFVPRAKVASFARRIQAGE